MHAESYLCPQISSFFFLLLLNWIELNWWENGFDFSESKVWLKIKAKFHFPFSTCTCDMCMPLCVHNSISAHEVYSHLWNPHSSKPLAQICSVFGEHRAAWQEIKILFRPSGAKCLPCCSMAWCAVSRLQHHRWEMRNFEGNWAQWIFTVDQHKVI